MKDEGNGRTWFLSDPRGNTVGPVGFDELRRLVHTGEITRDSLIRASLAEDWKPAGEALDFGELEKDPPPQAPVRKWAVLRDLLRVSFAFAWKRGVVPAANWLRRLLDRRIIGRGAKNEKVDGRTWFLSDPSGNTVGPVGFDELRRLVHTGEITRDSLIRASLAEDWKPAGEALDFGELEKDPPPQAPVRKWAVLRGLLRVLSCFWTVPRFLVVSVLVAFVCFLSKSLWFLLRNICVGVALALICSWRRGVVPVANWLRRLLNRRIIAADGKVEKVVGFVWKCLTGLLYYLLFVPLRALFRVTVVPVNRYWNKCEARRIANGAEMECPVAPPRLSWGRRIAYSSTGIATAFGIACAIVAATESPSHHYSYGGGSYQYADTQYQYQQPQYQYQQPQYQDQYQQSAFSFSPQAPTYRPQLQPRYQPKEKGFLAKAGDWISDHGVEIAATALAVAVGVAAHEYSKDSSPSPDTPTAREPPQFHYQYNTSHSTVGPGLDFTPSQRREIYQQHLEQSGGILISEESGTILSRAGRYTKGYVPDPREAQIDHIIPRSLGGENSAENARVISREENIRKSNHLE